MMEKFTLCKNCTISYSDEQKINSEIQRNIFSGFETFYHALTPDQKKKATKTTLKNGFRNRRVTHFTTLEKHDFPVIKLLLEGLIRHGKLI